MWAVRATSIVALLIGATGAWASCENNLTGSEFLRSSIAENSFVARFAHTHAIDPDDFEGDDPATAVEKFFGRVGRALNADAVDPLQLLRHDFGEDPKIAAYLADLERRVRRAGVKLMWNDVDGCESARTLRNEVKLGPHRYAHEAPAAACVFHVEHELRHEKFDDGWRSRDETAIEYVRRQFETMMDEELEVRLAERDVLGEMRDAGFFAPDSIVSPLSLKIWAARDLGVPREELWQLVAGEYAEETSRSLMGDWVRLQTRADERELTEAMNASTRTSAGELARRVFRTSRWAETMNAEEKIQYLEFLSRRILDRSDHATELGVRLTDVRQKMLSEPDAFTPPVSHSR